MELTKNDLSYNAAQLDYRALLRVSHIAFGHCLESISRYLAELREFPALANHTPHSQAKHLLSEANKLAVIAETMHTLEEGLSREDIAIVNKEG